jgi:3-hydroxyisobutyrate dehydrogenase-like beta-hydroxyacid dehydrogenase
LAADFDKREGAMKVGLVGLGRMGAAMAQRLKEHGFDVTAWDKNKDAMASAAKAGVTIADDPRGVSAATEIVISIITEDKGVRRIFTGKDGFLAGDVKGRLFIEMSTLQPMTHRELAPLVKAKGAALIDSPVLGTIPQVRDGKLLALVGGEAADVARAREVLDHLTRRIAHMGPNGAGCAMKLAANLGMAVYLQSLAEGIALGRKEGLSVDQILDIFGEMPIASPWLKGKVDILKGGPVTQKSLDIMAMRKDALSAIATGAIHGVPMPATMGAATSLSAACAAGWGDRDLAELVRYFQENMLQNFE